MKAILVKEPGGTEQLNLVDIDKPKPNKEEVLVKVKASAVNRADIVKRVGKYPNQAKENISLGLEVSGVIESVGRENSKYKVGDEVCGLMAEGGYAEYAILREDVIIPKPENLSFIEAAAIPEVFMTAYQTLFWLGKLKKGEHVLIHAGGSGVGTAAIQLAKQAGATVTVTAGSKEKLDFCQTLGADTLINYKEENFSEVIQEKTKKRGVDLILDFIGASYWEMNMKSIAVEGRIVLIGLLGGARVENFNLNHILAKRIQVTGTLLNPRSDQYKADLVKDLVDSSLNLFKSGDLKPIVDSTYKLADVGDAHNHMQASKNIGKIVLTVE
ncbi:MAG TPA: NAD(P)H-quinone oxidoreductase [Pseudogracilibacillus sp.]|nr:NAD(P)H-quinone oxidoreductase [Pseudogracilibacillus sp.]